MTSLDAVAPSRPRSLVHVVTVPMTLRLLAGQLAYMRERGWAVHVVSDPGEDLGRFAALEGVTPHPVPLTRRVTPVRDLAAVLALARLLRGLRPTIVHAHTPKGGLVLRLASCVGIGARVGAGSPLVCCPVPGMIDTSASRRPISP